MNFSINEHSYEYVLNRVAIEKAMAHFMSQVYFWMMIGLCVTGWVAYEVAQYPATVVNLLSHVPHSLMILLLIQIGLVTGLSLALPKLKSGWIELLYILYSASMGLSTGIFFFAFTFTSVASTFFITAFVFLGFSVWGYLAKRSLGWLGSFCMTGLLGLVGFYLVTFFKPDLMTTLAQKVTASIGIIVFAGLTAFDTYRIKWLGLSGFKWDQEATRKQAIQAALMIYLDFLNLFLSILQFTGKRK